MSQSATADFDAPRFRQQQPWTATASPGSCSIVTLSFTLTARPQGETGASDASGTRALPAQNGKARENRAAVACGPTPAGCPKPAASASDRAPARLQGKASGTSSGCVSNCLIAGATIAAEIRPGMVRRDASELAKLRNY
jgi:hypothetical protein